MLNATRVATLPPLPTYVLTPRPPLLPLLSDKLLVVLLPIAAYWVVSLFFHYLDVNDYLPQYRLHTPAEVLKRNRVSRYEVVRDVLLQQFIQALTGTLIAMTEPDDTIGREKYDIAVLARRIRVAQSAVPKVLALLGVNGSLLAQKLGAYPQIAGVVLGGQYPAARQIILGTAGEAVLAPAFATWELCLAQICYWLLIPGLQFSFAIFFLDTWQYFLHRGMHMNQWLYRTLHSRHHRLYVPYAFGALYNHPVEGFLLDTLGAGLAYMLTGMSTRQGMLFFTGSTIKTVDDHCGYSLPWDPLQRITSNNASYHDIHHQSWGIKTNFSQPFFTFWDRWLGTAWSGGDVSVRYERARKGVQGQPNSDAPGPGINGDLHFSSEKSKRQEADSRQQVLDDTAGGGAGVLLDEAFEEAEAQQPTQRDRRKRTVTTSSPSQSGGLKSLKDKVQRQPSWQGRCQSRP